MVFFKLISKDRNTYTYNYYPGKHLDKKPGVLVFSGKGELISFEPAEEDYEVVATVESDMESFKFINEDRIARGEPPMTLEEWRPLKEDEVFYSFATHCVPVISKSIKERNPIQENLRMWY